jgi:malonyl-CoA/methylmalonyl-CoA synthetase
MTNQNLYAILSENFSRNLSKVCLYLPDGSTCTYGELEQKTAQIANLLVNCGVKKGDRVAMQTGKCPTSVFLYLGCLRTGAAFLPLNTAYTDSELAYFFSNARPALIVCAPARTDGIEAVLDCNLKPRILTLAVDENNQDVGTLVEGMAANSTEFTTVVSCKNDLAAILYTSGTTGRSKGAMISHSNLGSNTRALHDIWHWSPDDQLIHALPVFHVHGLFVALNTMLMAGASCNFLNSFNAKEVLDLMPNATVMMGVPTFYTRLLDEDGLTTEQTATMRLFISGSAPMLEETHAAFTERTGHRILERYGMTEAGMITSNPYEGARVPGTVGFPLPDVEVRVADTQGNEVPNNEVGILEITGPNVFLEYWEMPEKTAKEFRSDGYFITGDMAIQDKEGRVSIVGRGKDLIISGGYNVYPKEVELCLDEIDGVLETAVIGLPHPDFGEAVAAVVVPLSAARSTLKSEDIVTQARKDLAAFKVPKSVFIVDELSRNTMGKVQKNVMRETYKDTFNG